MDLQVNPILVKSKAFALRIVRMYQYLSLEKKEFVLSRQILRSGTSIGANVREAQYAQSRKDFISKMSIALKEASETEYWLELLHESGYINDTAFKDIHQECTELVRIITSIVLSGKNHS